MVLIVRDKYYGPQVVHDDPMVGFGSRNHFFGEVVGGWDLCP